MKRSRHALALAIVAGLGAVQGWAAQGWAAETVVRMDAATQRRLGLRTAALAAGRQVETVAGFARGLDVSPLATLQADIATASAALHASAAEAARTRTLAAADATVSRKSAEAAAAQARADAAKLSLMHRRVGLEWGPALAAMSDARRDRLVAAVAAGRAALVRIDLPGGATASLGSATLDLGGRGRAMAAILGPARVGDPRLQATGLLALVSGPGAAWVGVGAVVPASLGSAKAGAGVILPRSALLRTGGQTFAYVRRGPAAFERRAVLGASSAPAGLVAPTGFRPGEQVVVEGAAQLFAAEQAPAKEE